MNATHERKQKLMELLRYGKKRGWVIPQANRSIIIADSAPAVFHQQLSEFADLFTAEFKSAEIPS